MKTFNNLLLFIIGISISASANADTNAQLAELCKVWGLVKFYNNNVVSGKVSCDSLLLQTLPLVKSATNNAEFNRAINLLLSKAGPVEVLKKKKHPDYDTTFCNLDFKWVNASVLLDEENKITLLKTVNNYKPALNKCFKTEFNVNKTSPDTRRFYDDNIGLLGLFRYWNYINYFYPHKNIIDENWDSVLVEFIPKFLVASNKETYILCMAEIESLIF